VTTQDLPEATASWLVSAAGLRAVESACRLLADGLDALQVGARVRDQTPREHAPAVVAAADARQRASAAGYPDATRLVLTRAALEQASRPDVAAWRARRLATAGAPVVDLCCGAGLDTAAISRAAPVRVAVDLDPSRVALARHNTEGLAVAAVRAADALEVAAGLGPDVVVHADPSRRSDGRRARRLGEYGPPVGALLAAAGRTRGTGVAISPAVDWSDPDLPADVEVEFLQVGGDLVEATLWTGELRGAAASATLLPGGETLRREGRPEEAPAGRVGTHLVEVAAAAVRARVHDTLAARIGARRLDRGRALLTTDGDPGPSPWWRRWEIEAVLSARPKVVRRWLAGAEPQPLAISVHGLDVDPTAWWRSLGDVPRGPEGRRLHLVRTVDGGRCVVGRDLR
jgi:SAM-dependent methyltransferase